MRKILLSLILFLILPLSSTFAKDMDKTSYLVGASVGSVVGLGIGNLIQDRYLPNGIFYTTTQTVGMGIFIYSMTAGPNPSFSNVQSILGLSIFIASKAIEIFDLWVTPHFWGNKISMVPIIEDEYKGCTFVWNF